MSSRHLDMVVRNPHMTLQELIVPEWKARGGAGVREETQQRRVEGEGSRGTGYPSAEPGRGFGGRVEMKDRLEPRFDMSRLSAPQKVS